MHEEETGGMEGQYRFELSVVFLTYNSAMEKIARSLDTIIRQERVNLEIIVADDGSKENHEKELKELFREYGFANYKLVMNPENGGTVKNLLSGLMSAEGEYVKGISPGDMFYERDTARKWLDYMKAAGCSWSFSDAVYYADDHGIGRTIRTEAHPLDVSPYIRNRQKQCRWNYVVLEDIALGATFMSTADILKRGCALIAGKGIVYAEDNLWRILMFKGETGRYYPGKTVYYECGTGISTQKSDIWAERLQKDWSIADSIMAEMPGRDEFQDKMLRAVKMQQTPLKRKLIRGEAVYAVKKRFIKRYTNDGGQEVCKW